MSLLKFSILYQSQEMMQKHNITLWLTMWKWNHTFTACGRSRTCQNEAASWWLRARWMYLLEWLTSLRSSYHRLARQPRRRPRKRTWRKVERAPLPCCSKERKNNGFACCAFCDTIRPFRSFYRAKQEKCERFSVRKDRKTLLQPKELSRLILQQSVYVFVRQLDHTGIGMIPLGTG